MHVAQVRLALDSTSESRHFRRGSLAVKRAQHALNLRSHLIRVSLVAHRCSQLVEPCRHRSVILMQLRHALHQEHRGVALGVALLLLLLPLLLLQ